MNVSHVGAYVRSPRVARWKKILAVLAVVYAISPVDLVPDVVPIFGWLDDIGVLAVAFGMVARDMSKHAKLAKDAANKPAELTVDAVR